jgi:tight adherence protein B
MQGELNLLLAAIVFVGACAFLVGMGLFLLSVILRARARHNRRLARVSRRRLAGHLDIEETRLHRLRQSEESSVLVAATEAIARVVPVLDTARLRANIRRAQISLTVSGFLVIAGLLGALFLVTAVFGLGFAPGLAAIPSFLAGMLAVDAAVRLRGEMMAERFMKQMPEALDAIIRGVRAGLPVLECIGTVGEEFDGPISLHFRTISERVQIGEPLDVALWRVADVIDRPEMDFMAVCISIQMETGGSLAEALGNLAALLRAREAMKLKIRAISSEAKASALIIGLLPFVMLGLLTMINPAYVMPLFVDPRGQFMLMLAGGSIGFGALVMWRMTRFEI